MKQAEMSPFHSNLRILKSPRTLVMVLTFISFLFPTMAVGQTAMKNEISFHSNLVRGGFTPNKFFDGSALGFSYNREIFPYVMIHSNIVAAQLFDETYQSNSMVNTDLGFEIAPFEFNRFQVRFGFAGSIQVRNSAEIMNPETFISWGGGGRINIIDQETGNVTVIETPRTSTIYNFRSVNLGYKFELKLRAAFRERLYVSPLAAMRAYPGGNSNYIPNSFEIGLQTGIKF